MKKILFLTLTAGIAAVLILQTVAGQAIAHRIAPLVLATGVAPLAVAAAGIVPVIAVLPRSTP